MTDFCENWGLIFTCVILLFEFAILICKFYLKIAIQKSRFWGPRNVPYTGTFRGLNFDHLHDGQKFNRPKTYTVFDLKCALHGHIWAFWIQVNSKIWIHFEFTRRWIRHSKCALHGHISRILLARKASKNSHSRKFWPRARTKPKCARVGHISASKWSKASFWILTSEFLKYWRNWSRIGAKVVEITNNCCSISPTLLNFWIFRNFEIECRKGELTPPILGLTTCSFYCEVTINFDSSRIKTTVATVKNYT